MNTRFISLIFLFLLQFKQTGWAQTLNARYRPWLGVVNNLHQYGAAADFPNDQVADDFGPRQLDRTVNGQVVNVPYDWHGGIDYNSNTPGNDDYGDILLALENVNATLNTNGPDETGTKWITIDGNNNLTYVHIFTGGQIPNAGMNVGGCTLKRMDTPNQDEWCIIFKIGGTYTAIGPVAGNVTFTNEQGTAQTIAVGNTVTAGDPVAALGNSNGFAPHAHLQTMINLVNQNGGVIYPWNDANSRNPLQFVNHTTMNYNIALTQQNVPQGISPVYPGTNRTPLRARITLQGEAGNRYNGGIMDIEKVEFKLDHLSTAGGYFAIQGPSVDAIKIGGLLNSTPMPPNLRTQGVGGWNRTGVSPFAYYNNPYDDYYFIDFYARIHKNDPMNGGAADFAFLPWDARFTDGAYRIKASVTAVTNATTANHLQDSAPTDIQIDNFKPFIHGAEVFFEGPHVRAYRCYWEALNASSSKLKLGAHEEGGIPNLSTAGNLVVYGIASEALQQGTVTAEIPTLSTGQVIGSLEAGSDGKKWRFNFGSTFNPPLAYGQCHKIIFRGRDANNNDLLDFQVNNPNNCNWGITTQPTVPKRNGANSWDNATPTDKDEVHRFRILECGPQLLSDVPESTDPCLTAEQVDADIHYATPGQSDGAIYLTISGNPNGISIIWYDEDHNQVGSGTSLENVPAGDYCYEIKDMCCLLSECFKIEECMLDVTGVIHHPVNGQSDGIIFLTVTGGGDMLKYEWSGGLPPNSYQFNLGPGSYTVTVTDEFHCEAVETFTLRDCSLNPIQMYSDVIHESSPGASNGSIDLVIESGVSPFTYQWAGPNNFSSTQEDISGLAPGQYCVTVTDAIGCTAPHCAIVNPCDPVIAAGTGVNCPYNQGGYMWLQLQGTGPFSILWSDGIGQSAYGPNYQRNNLTPGVYCVTVTNQAKCSEVICRVVSSSVQPIQINGAVQNTTCRQANGSIILSVTGGYSPYTYSWNDGVTTKDRNNIAFGTYCVTVSDNTGCTQTACFTLSDQSTNLKVAIAGLNMITDCFGTYSECDGSINIEPVNGVAPFMYSWTGPEGFVSNQQDLSALCEPGVYRITITDAYGCTATDQINICCCSSGEPGHGGGIGENACEFGTIMVNGAVTPAQGSQGGSINLYVYSGGSGTDYSLVWKKNGIFYSYEKNITNLTPGQYCVTVSNGCTSVTKCFTIVDCNQTQINVSGSTQPACPNYAAGTISISASGGTSPYTYKWSNGSTNQNLNQLTAGTYTVTVTDKNGCTKVASFTVASQQLTVVNQGCTSYTYCGSQVVNVQQFSENWQVDPFDCSRMRVVCANGYEGPWITVPPTPSYPFGPYACVIEWICANGDLYDQVTGYTETGLVGGIDECGVPYCAYVTYCYYPQLDGYDENSIQLTGQYGNITRTYYGSGCNLPIYCNPPSTCCRYKYYCEGYYIGIGVGMCQVLAPPGSDADVLPGRESLIQALEAQNPDLKRINIGKITDMNTGDSPAQRTALWSASANPNAAFKVYPNPFDDNLTVEINAKQSHATMLSLFDVHGKLLLQQTAAISVGPNKIGLNIKADYPPGTYILKYIDAEGKTVANLLVKLAP